MAEEHRRVEARQIVGTGMATDPERILQIAADAERRARAWREAPETGFGDVMERAPARGELADQPPQPPPPQPADLAGAPASTPASTTTQAPATTTKAPVPTAKPLRTSLRAPDPRQRALQHQLDQAIAASSRKDS